MAGLTPQVSGSISTPRFPVIDDTARTSRSPIRSMGAHKSRHARDDIISLAGAVARPVFSTRRKNEVPEATEFFALTVLRSNQPSKPPHRSTRAPREELRGLSVLVLPLC
jgi:hypothetical protein